MLVRKYHGIEPPAALGTVPPFVGTGTKPPPLAMPPFFILPTPSAAKDGTFFPSSISPIIILIFVVEHMFSNKYKIIYKFINLTDGISIE